MRKFEIDFRILKKKWPYTYVARTPKQLGRFSGGILSARCLELHDSLGTGPMEVFTVEGKVAYTVDSLIEWMEQNVESLDLKDPFYEYIGGK